MPTSTKHLGFFYMSQIYDMGPPALLPLRRNYRLIFSTIISTFRCSDLSRRVGRGDIWRRQWELLEKIGSYNKPNGCSATGALAPGPITTNNNTAHYKYKRLTSLPSAGFEPAIPAVERPQTYALDHMTL
jgi:hypothetical protein